MECTTKLCFAWTLYGYFLSILSCKDCFTQSLLYWACRQNLCLLHPCCELPDAPSGIFPASLCPPGAGWPLGALGQTWHGMSMCSAHHSALHICKPWTLSISTPSVKSLSMLNHILSRATQVSRIRFFNRLLPFSLSWERQDLFQLVVSSGVWIDL